MGPIFMEIKLSIGASSISDKNLEDFCSLYYNMTDLYKK